MSLLQFDATLSLSPAEKTSFAETVTGLYTTEMATTRGHVSVSTRVAVLFRCKLEGFRGRLAPPSVN